MISAAVPSPAAGDGTAFDGTFSAFKERQLVFQLTRQLAEAQFARGDRARSERLWQEAAAQEIDPERIIALLYGVADHGDTAAMEAIDRAWREERQRRRRRAPWALGRWPGLSRRRREASHRGAPRAAAPARRGGR